jgi:DNA-binding MarR family transcriptional regulator
MVRGMAKTVGLETLDVGSLGYFVGLRFNSAVEAQLGQTDHRELRASHGFLFQHLVHGRKTISELARRMEVTQQAASKAVGELERMGYVRRTADDSDARVSRVELTEKAWDAVKLGRELRAELEEKLRRKHGAKAIAAARAVLAEVLETLGGVPAVRSRRVIQPR